MNLVSYKKRETIPKDEKVLGCPNFVIIIIITIVKIDSSSGGSRSRVERDGATERGPTRGNLPKKKKKVSK